MSKHIHELHVTPDRNADKEASASPAGIDRTASGTGRLSTAKKAIQPPLILIPAALTALAIILTVQAYSPLEFDPDSITATSQAQAAELEQLDASQLEVVTEEEAEAEALREAAASAVSLGADTSNLKDGTYTGTAYGYKSYITVAVTIKNGKITAIVIKSQDEDAEYFNAAVAVISKVLKAQSPNVDVVSGATYSSNGILQAIANALAKAQAASGSSGSVSIKAVAASSAVSTSSPTSTSGVNVAETTLADGTWSGSGDGYAVYFYDGYPIEVDVTIKNGVITSIVVTYQEEDEAYYNMAVSVISSVLAAQSTDVDTVSGATYSSKGILAAIEDALSKSAAAAASGSDSSDSAGSSSDSGSDSSDSSSSSSSGSSDSDSSDSASSDSSDSSSSSDSSDSTDSSDSSDSSDDSSSSEASTSTTYLGAAFCQDGVDAGSWSAYYVIAKITVEDGVVTELSSAYGDAKGLIDTQYIYSASENGTYFNKALAGTLKRTGVKKQINNLISAGSEVSLSNVDVISGATYSSQAIVKAYLAAVDAALDAAESGTDTSSSIKVYDTGAYVASS